MKISADVNTLELARRMGLAERQLPFATSLALNRTGQLAVEATRKTIAGVFDRPTPFTRNSPRLFASTKARLYAEVFLRDAPRLGEDHFLLAQIQGGGRSRKRIEKRLGERLGGGIYVVPGQAAERDQFGNVKRSVYGKILAQTQTAFDPLQRETEASRGRRRRSKKRGGEFFLGTESGRTGHLAGGVWERIETGFGSAVRPVLLRVNRAPTYRKRLPFFEAVANVYRRRYPDQLRQAIKSALNSAR